MARWGKTRKSELLAQMPLFSACSRRQLALVSSFTVPDELPAGTILTREGATGGIAYILASGTAEVLRGGRRLALLGPGDVVGELSLIDGKPRSATVKAVSDLEVLEIDARDLASLLRKAPEVTRNLLVALAGRLRETDALPAAGLRARGNGARTLRPI
jgi:CRP/FNR family transcriptional regulator, cyclic AMP receptor protein